MLRNVDCPCTDEKCTCTEICKSLTYRPKGDIAVVTLQRFETTQVEVSAKRKVGCFAHTSCGSATEMIGEKECHEDIGALVLLWFGGNQK